MNNKVNIMKTIPVSYGRIPRYNAEECVIGLVDRMAIPARSAAARKRRNEAAAALQARIEQMAGCYISIGDTRPAHAAAAIVAGRDPWEEQVPELVED